MLLRLWLLVGSDRLTDRLTMSLIELSWTAKNCIRPPYKKLKPLKSGFIENSNFENNRDPWWRVKRYLGNAKIQGPLFKKGASLIGMLYINFKVWRWMKKTFDTCRQSRPPKRSIFGSSLSISRPLACFLGWLFSAQRILSRCENFPFLFVFHAIPSPQHQKLISHLIFGLDEWLDVCFGKCFESRQWPSEKKILATT